MGLVFRRECPWCGERLPYRPPPDRQIPRGFLAPVGVVCPQCDRESHQAVSIRAALVWWPIAAVLAGTSAYCIRVIAGEGLSPGTLFLAVGGGIAAIILAAIAFIAGHEQVRTATPPPSSWLLVVLKVTMVVILLGIVTGYWISAVVLTSCSLLLEATFRWRLVHNRDPDPNEPPAADREANQ